MKTLFVISCVSLVIYAVLLPVQQRAALHQAVSEAAAGRFASALDALDYARRARPQLYKDEATQLCGNIMLTQARHLADGAEPDFGGAAGVLHDLATRCGDTGRAGEAARLLEWVAAQHLGRAKAGCEVRDYARAFNDFQHMLLLPYPERAVAQARQEFAWCRLQQVRVLAQPPLFDTAFEELHRLIRGEPGPVREAALREVPSLVQAEVHWWLEKKQYHVAFRTLGQRQQTFGDLPEIAYVFTEVARQAELEVFHVVLATQCHEAAASGPKTGKTARPVTVATEAQAAAEAVSPANLLLQNDTKYPLKILLRGPEDHDILLKPSTKTALTVAAAHYLVGVYAPGNCHVQSGRTSWRIESWAPYSVRFYAGEV
jgi:hypothetical protein